MNFKKKKHSWSKPRQGTTLISFNRSKTVRSRNKKKVKSSGSGDWRGFIGFVVLGLSLLAMVSLISNLFNPADNMLGRYFGTALSHLLISFAGKVPSLLLPAILFYIGWNYITKVEISKYFRQLFFASVIFIELCIFASIRNLGLGRSWEQFYNTGGVLGNFIVQNILTIAFGTQRIGAYLVMAIIMTGTCIWGFRIDVYALALRIKAMGEMIGSFTQAFFRQVQFGFAGSASTATAAPNRIRVKSGINRPQKQLAAPHKETEIDDAVEMKNASIPAEFTEEELENLPLKKALEARLEKRQRAFLEDYNGPSIKEMIEEEALNLEKEVEEKIAKRGRKSKMAGKETENAPQTMDKAITGDDEVCMVEEESDNGDGQQGVFPKVVEIDPPEEDATVYDPYVVPSMDLLAEHEQQERKISQEEIQANADRLIEKLKDFKIQGRIGEVCPGPVVTRYELELAPGTKVAKVESLSLDLAIAMAVEKIRISLVPGKAAIGIELPNVHREKVFIKNVLTSKEFAQTDSQIKLVVGKDIAGKPFVVDLVKMPHMLIAGTTGSGKSMCTNSFLASILLAKSPDEVKLILVDPKVVEMNLYNGIPHLLSNVITNPKEAVSALKWGVAEMERRYQMLAKAICRNIAQFNDKVKDGSIMTTSIDEADKKRMPYIVIIIDELADLMCNCGKELEEEIVRLAQKARAVGIHLILATQRPEAKVVTGLIKSNMPSRVALTVNSAMDSRIIIDERGAEELLMYGDMLYKSAEMPQVKRIHGTYIETMESEALVEFVKNQNVKRDKMLSFEQEHRKAQLTLGAAGYGGEMSELMEAAKIIVSRQIGSTSLLQRKMSIGYAKAGRLNRSTFCAVEARLSQF